MSGYSWVFVQRETAKFTRACWYDRAGFGWSDPGPNPRDGAAIANDLHALLEAAGERAPYVLAGATFGALYARVYLKRYPQDVAGMVLVNPIRADEATNPKTRGLAPQFLHYPQSVLVQGLNQIGLVRFFEMGARAVPGGPPPGLTADEWTMIWRLRNAPKTRVALMQELVADFAAEDRAAGTLEDVPHIVLNSDLNSSVVAAVHKLVTQLGGRR